MTENIRSIYSDRATASDVDWSAVELPIALPSGLSEGASLIKMKDGRIGVIQRGSHGMHNGVNVLDGRLVDAIKKLIG